MGFIDKLKIGWKSMSTEEKIGTIIDVICGVGSTSIGMTVGNKLSEGKGIIGKICIKTTCLGLGYAGGDISSKALRNQYAAPLGVIIDKMKAKNDEKKEEDANG